MRLLQFERGQHPGEQACFRLCSQNTAPEADMRALCKHRHQHEACVASTSSRCDASAKPRLRSAQRAKHKQQQQKRTSVRASAVEDVDIQVFRFTLGIPGFDDANIPRVVGFLGAALLALNHSASSAVSDAQVCPH